MLRPTDPNRCQEIVRTSGVRMGRWHQCASAIKVTRDGKGYCRLHDPEAVTARFDKRNSERVAKYRASQRLHEREARKVRFGEEAIKAIRLIAQGHPSPMALAGNVLDKWDDKS